MPGSNLLDLTRLTMCWSQSICTDSHWFFGSPLSCLISVLPCEEQVRVGHFNKPNTHWLAGWKSNKKKHVGPECPEVSKNSVCKWKETS